MFIPPNPATQAQPLRRVGTILPIASVVVVAGSRSFRPSRGLLECDVKRVLTEAVVDVHSDVIENLAYSNCGPSLRHSVKLSSEGLRFPIGAAKAGDPESDRSAHRNDFLAMVLVIHLDRICAKLYRFSYQLVNDAILIHSARRTCN
jgi:hypothetical protein